MTKHRMPAIDESSRGELSRAGGELISRAGGQLISRAAAELSRVAN